MENKDPHRYDYMIYMQPSEPLFRRTMHHRAAQFMGFRAVAGHEDMIREEGRVTEEKLELDELEKASLDYKMLILMKELPNEPVVKLTYFEKDMFKSGGRYVSHTGIIKKVDVKSKVLFFKDNSIIKVKDIIEIESDIFDNYCYDN